MHGYRWYEVTALFEDMSVHTCFMRAKTVERAEEMMWEEKSGAIIIVAFDVEAVKPRGEVKKSG